ncbi:hypothetical protein [Geodermatophilus sp. SYSU D01119]
MNTGPRSWTTSIVGFALMVLVVSAALNLAAELLREALPVLIPTAIVVLMGYGIWHWRTRARGW